MIRITKISMHCEIEVESKTEINNIRELLTQILKIEPGKGMIYFNYEDRTKKIIENARQEN